MEWLWLSGRAHVWMDTISPSDLTLAGAEMNLTLPGPLENFCQYRAKEANVLIHYKAVLHVQCVLLANSLI